MPVSYSALSMASQQPLTLSEGFLHPLIHLGFGLEFKQPAIIVEGIAQTAIHANELSAALLTTKRFAENSESKPIVDLIHEVERHHTIRDNPAWQDGSLIEDDFFLRAPEELMAIASQWHVKPDELEDKVAEMINVNAYFTAAAQNPAKKVKLDFFFIHNVNCTIFFSDFLTSDVFSREEQAKLLEWKGRFDIIAYGARGAPRLHLDEIVNYKPKIPGSWDDIFKRANEFPDDSHLSKFIRAVANGERVSKAYEQLGGNKFPIKDPSWLQIAHMAVDSMDDETYINRWIRGAGFAEQWAKFPDRVKN
jgi:hypothetical protein